MLEYKISLFNKFHFKNDNFLNIFIKKIFINLNLDYLAILIKFITDSTNYS